MATILALEKLYTDVVARFGVEGTFGVSPSPVAAATIANRFGWREPPRQLAPTTRIEWVPGDDSGNAGDVGPAKYPHKQGTLAAPIGRPLATLNELFTVYLHGFDPTQPLNELAQWKATRLLYDAWIRAVYLAAHGTFAIKSTRWLTERAEKRFGATLRVVGIIESMIPDTTPTFAPVDVDADVTVIELDRSELQHVDGPPPPGP